MRVLLGVSGSIAAYKSLVLCRQLIKNGHEVKVIMTSAATEFVSSLSFSTLSKNEVHTSVIDNDSWANHVELGLWADVMVIAPATSATLARMTIGLADNILVACYLSAKCPVYIAPAMDLDMWKHPSTKANIVKLQEYGNHIIPVGHGELASGLYGDGRMAEPEDIVSIIESFAKKKADLAGQSVLITAGPTKELLDPVRFIGNQSSGLMGLKLAEECADRGAQVHLVLGPTHLTTHHPLVKIYHVVSAADMYESCRAVFDQCDIAIFAAAVADYRPRSYSDAKIKKNDGDLSIVLERTIDIAAVLGKIKRQDQLTIGFALETNDETNNALAKLNKKNFDLIVLNSLNDKGAGFKHNTNKVTIFHKDGSQKAFELKPKKEVAADIIDELIKIK
jgi:phosphopantothenoylcysteine decarboxylase/phosphopantothenate--cysteine ligase